MTEKEDFDGFCRDDFTTCCVRVVLRRQKRDGREMITVERDGIVIYTGWRKDRPNRRRVGGKKSYVKLWPERMSGLSDADIAALVRLSPWIRTDGSLREPRHARTAARKDLYRLWDVGERKGRRILNGLVERNILRRENGDWKLSREYLARG